MGSVSAARAETASGSVRSELRDTEESFGSILTDIAVMLYPPPNTAAKIAADLACSVRSAELCLAGTQKWSGDAVALFVAEIMRRHRMRNFKVLAKR